MAPGTYKARLTVGGSSEIATFEVLADPRTDIPAEAFADQQALLAAVYADADAIQRSVETLKTVREQVQAVIGIAGRGHDPSAIVGAGEALIGKLGDWEDSVIESRNENFIDALHSSGRLDFNMLYMLWFADRMDPPITSGLARRVATLRAQWTERKSALDAILGDDLAAFNAAAGGLAFPPITADGIERAATPGSGGDR